MRRRVSHEYDWMGGVSSDEPEDNPHLDDRADRAWRWVSIGSPDGMDDPYDHPVLHDDALWERYQAAEREMRAATHALLAATVVEPWTPEEIRRAGVRDRS